MCVCVYVSVCVCASARVFYYALHENVYQFLHVCLYTTDLYTHMGICALHSFLKVVKHLRVSRSALQIPYYYCYYYHPLTFPGLGSGTSSSGIGSQLDFLVSCPLNGPQNALFMSCTVKAQMADAVRPLL